MKINIFKSIVVFLLTAIILIILTVLFDLSGYDSSYINRNSLTFSSNNLNIQEVRKFLKYYNNFYHEIKLKISKDYRENWEPEEVLSRLNLPEKKIIPKKIDNFLPGRKINEIEKNFSNWPRSHGGFSSMRFSSLDLIIKII